MGNQKSFSFSYKLNESTNNEVEFDAHVNVWNISDKKENPFIDFGLLIRNYQNVNSICFISPFKVENENIDDLSHLLKENEIQLIFNNSKYKYKQIPDSIYAGYDDANKETVLILPIKDEAGKNLTHISCQSTREENLKLIIYLYKCRDIPKSIKSIYIRFRIKNIDTKKLLSTLSAKNNYLESAFIKRQILDFKLNNVRTIDKFDLSALNSDGYILTQFKAIHLFVMVPSDYEISIWGDFSECRQLEKDEWNDYLNNYVLDSTNDISAYHWKQVSKEEQVDEFAQLIKMEHKATNWKLIFIYCLIVIILGSLGSALYEGIKSLVKLIISIVQTSIC